MSYLGHRPTKVENYNPLDTVEDYIDKQNWNFERLDYQEMLVQISGKWAEYRLGILWRPEINYLCFSCQFDLKTPSSRKADVMELIVRANEKIWLGHFDFCSELSGPIFRYSLPLRGINILAVEQVEDLLQNSIHECERFFPVFQFVIWAKHPPEKAMEMAILETVGEA